jgi:hypothetical protein
MAPALFTSKVIGTAGGSADAGGAAAAMAKSAHGSRNQRGRTFMGILLGVLNIRQYTPDRQCLSIIPC